MIFHPTSQRSSGKTNCFLLSGQNEAKKHFWDQFCRNVLCHSFHISSFVGLWLILLPVLHCSWNVLKQKLLHLIGLFWPIINVGFILFFRSGASFSDTSPGSTFRAYKLYRLPAHVSAAVTEKSISQVIDDSPPTLVVAGHSLLLIHVISDMK